MQIVNYHLLIKDSWFCITLVILSRSVFRQFIQMVLLVGNAGFPSSNNVTSGGFLSKRKFKEPVLHIFAHNKVCKINHNSSNFNFNWLFGKRTQETQKGKPTQRSKGKWQKNFYRLFERDSKTIYGSL